MVEMLDLEKKLKSISIEIAGMKYMLADLWNDLDKKLKNLRKVEKDS